MKRPSTAKQPGRLSIELLPSEATRSSFCSVPPALPRRPNASRVKALRSPACSAPQARPLEEQRAQPTASAAPHPTQSAPRVITVEKNAASPKALAELKAAGLLPESVDLKPG